jgi:ssDNA-binding replication factor A large subunit
VNNVKISELEGNSTFDVIKARILSKQGPNRVGSRAKGYSYVWSILIADESGTTVLSIWGGRAGEGYKTGEVIRITNGWCKVFGGTKQVSTGRAGKIEKMPDDPALPRQIQPS